jgi:stage V sporulation protein SpoVS
MAGREPLQLGAEIYGHAGLEADLEIQELALDGLLAAGLGDLVIDLADARIVRAVLADQLLPSALVDSLAAALASKNQAELQALSAGLPPEMRNGLLALPALYGGPEVLALARTALPQRPQIAQALDDLAWLAKRLAVSHPQVRLGFDLADTLQDLIKRPFIWLGFSAFVILLALAATSFNRAVRWLGVRRWQLLHRGVYAVAVLAVLHFWWMRAGKQDFDEVLVYAGILAVLLGWRVKRVWTQRAR